MAKQKRKNSGGYKSTVSKKNKQNQNKQAEVKNPGNVLLKRIAIGLSVMAIISIALIVYLTVQNSQNDSPRNNSDKAASVINKANPEPNPESSPIVEQSKPEDNTGNNASSTAPEIQFETMVYDYGRISKGSDGSYEFAFKNAGKGPLVLSDVKSSCGCTIPTWPREPVLAGNRAVIKVVYDTKSVGPFTKFITVTSNASNDIVRLSITGEVVEN